MPPPEPVETIGWILVPRIPCAFATSTPSVRPPCGYIRERCRNCLLDGTRADLHDPIDHEGPSMTRANPPTAVIDTGSPPCDRSSGEADGREDRIGLERLR